MNDFALDAQQANLHRCTICRRAGSYALRGFVFCDDCVQDLICVRQRYRSAHRGSVQVTGADPRTAFDRGGRTMAEVR